ncbi:sensor histidine kinase [Paenibacillus sp. strain BS8-2]
MKQSNVFRRIMLLIICLFIPIVGVYTYSNYRTQGSLTEQIESLNMSRSLFFVSQLNSRLERLKENAFLLSNDDDVELFKYYDLLDEWERLQLKQRLLEKLIFLNSNNDWNDWLALISPRNHYRIYANFTVADADEYTEPVKPISAWQLQELSAGPMNRKFLTWDVAFPFTSSNENYVPQLVVQVGISHDTLMDMLMQFKNEQQGDAFLYAPGQPVISEGVLPQDALERWEASRPSGELSTQGSMTLELAQGSYLVNYNEIESMGWHLVTLTPRNVISEPIEQGRIIFYMTLCLLLLFALSAGYLIFRYVQIPVSDMLKVVRRFEKGEYSIRLRIGKGHDFTYLFQSFNRMAGTIQELIEKVYLEQIRSREARLKQLQSQINPHFLYNSLYFVESMIHLDKKKAASDMVMNLAGYFRYATYTGKQNTRFADELKISESYLRIHNLRNQRFNYIIEVPEEMLEIEVPRLILQPIIENAIVHGIEAKEGDGLIRIAGYLESGKWRIVIEDNGPGMTEEEQAKLAGDWQLPAADQSESCGTFNVNQRLQLHYGEAAGIEFETPAGGGCRVILKLGIVQQQEGDIRA